MQFEIIRRVGKIGKALVFTIIQRYSDENRSSRLQLFPSRWCAKSKKFMLYDFYLLRPFHMKRIYEYQLITIQSKSARFYCRILLFEMEEL